MALQLGLGSMTICYATKKNQVLTNTWQQTMNIDKEQFQQYAFIMCEQQLTLEDRQNKKALKWSPGNWKM